MNIEISNRFYSAFGFEVDEVFSNGYISAIGVIKKLGRMMTDLELNFLNELNENLVQK